MNTLNFLHNLWNIFESSSKEDWNYGLSKYVSITEGKNYYACKYGDIYLIYFGYPKKHFTTPQSWGYVYKDGDVLILEDITLVTSGGKPVKIKVQTVESALRYLQKQLLERQAVYNRKWDLIFTE